MVTCVRAHAYMLLHSTLPKQHATKTARCQNYTATKTARYQNSTLTKQHAIKIAVYQNSTLAKQRAAEAERAIFPQHMCFPTV